MHLFDVLGALPHEYMGLIFSDSVESLKIYTCVFNC